MTVSKQGSHQCLWLFVVQDEEVNLEYPVLTLLPKCRGCFSKRPKTRICLFMNSFATIINSELYMNRSVHS